MANASVTEVEYGQKLASTLAQLRTIRLSRTGKRPARPWECQECGARLTTAQAMYSGCPKCGSFDADLAESYTVSA